jgi:putative hydrolase of the HAD superfamily
MTQIQSFTELVPRFEAEPPQVMFFDAMGTLFGLRGSVGDIYGQIAQSFGVQLDSTELNQAFFDHFKNAPPLAFGESEPLLLVDLEYQWWYAIAFQAFSQIQAVEKFSDFDQFFQTLYKHFASEKPWFVYPDVMPMLHYWQKKGIKLGVISNFDSRLDQVLIQLKLTDFFSQIIYSSRQTIAKPDPRIFQLALDHWGFLPSQAWHIGDSLREDYNGATAAGLKAFLIQRSD